MSKRWPTERKSEQLRIRELIADRDPGLETWKIYRTRNSLAVAYWLAIRELAAARGVSIATARNMIKKQHNRLIGDYLEQKREAKKRRKGNG